METEVNFWIKKDDEELFRKGIKADVETLFYLDGILTGRIRDSSVLSRLQDSFVLGRRRVWLPEDENGEVLPGKVVPFVRIGNCSRYKNNSRYRGGLILAVSPDETDEDCHLRYLPAIEKARIPIVPLLGDKNEKLVSRILRTYNSAAVDKGGRRDYHLFLYKVLPVKA